MERTATPAEVTQMKKIVRDALDAGAVGFSTSTLEQHNGDRDIPVPSRFADENEMLELTGALGDTGKGVFMLTKGMTTTVLWLEDVAARNGHPVMIAAMFTDLNDPERVMREFGEIEAASKHGRELWGQIGCSPHEMEFSMALPYPFHAMLAWRPAIEALGTDRYEQLMADQSFRETVKAEALTRGVPLRFSYHSFEQMRVKDAPNPKFKSLVGSVVADPARAAAKDPFDWVFDHETQRWREFVAKCIARLGTVVVPILSFREIILRWTWQC